MNRLQKNEPNTPAEENGLNNLDRIDPDRVDELPSTVADKDLADESKESYKSDIRELNDWLEENDRTVSGDALRDYFQHLDEELAPATLNRKRYSILRILKTYGNGYAPLVSAIESEVKNNTKSYTVKNRVDGDKVPTPEQVNETITTARESGKGRLALVIETLFRTGLRVSELINIKPDRDIEENGRVKLSVRGKGDKERTVGLDPDLYDRIRDTFDHPDAEYLFHSSTGNQYNRSNLYRQLKRLDVDAPRSPHSYRHAFATKLIQEGIPLKNVADILGHADPATTAEMYCHVRTDWDQIHDLTDLDTDTGT